MIKEAQGSKFQEARAQEPLSSLIGFHSFSTESNPHPQVIYVPIVATLCAGRMHPWQVKSTHSATQQTTQFGRQNEGIRERGAAAPINKSKGPLWERYCGSAPRPLRRSYRHNGKNGHESWHRGQDRGTAARTERPEIAPGEGRAQTVSRAVGRVLAVLSCPLDFRNREWRGTEGRGCRLRAEGVCAGQPGAPGTQDRSVVQKWVCGHPHQACPSSLCARPAVTLTLGRAVTV